MSFLQCREGKQLPLVDTLITTLPSVKAVMLAFKVHLTFFLQIKQNVPENVAQLTLRLNALDLLLSAGVQSLPVRQRVDASQRLLQEAGGQEVAQHG